MVFLSTKRKNIKSTSQVKSKQLKTEIDENKAKHSENEEIDEEHPSEDSSDDDVMIKQEDSENDETESEEIDNENFDNDEDDENGDKEEDNDETSDEELLVYEDKNSKQSGDEENSCKLEQIPFDTTKSMKNDNLMEKYMKQKGKSLYVLFPHKLPLNENNVEEYVKGFCPSIIKVRRARQKSSRFCLVDFENIEERTKGMEKLKTIDIKGKKLIVSVPRTEDDDFVAKLIDKRNKKKEILKTKRKLRKEALKNASESEMGTKLRTSTVIVTNIPAESSLLDVNNLFPNAVEVKVKFAKEKDQTSIATVTVPTPEDATQIVHSKHQIGDNKLKVVYATTKHVQCNDLLQNNKKTKMKHSEDLMLPKKLSNTIVVTNIPPESSIIDITQAFPKAKDIKVDFARDNTQTSSAKVIFKNPGEANEARKQKIKLGENNLRMTFDFDLKTNQPNQNSIGQRTPLVSGKDSGHRSSTLLVKRIPKETTESELKNLVPNAVEIKLKPPTDKYDCTMAIVTLPTPDDASAVHKKTLKVGENSLKIYFPKKLAGKNRGGISNKLSKKIEKPEGSI